MRCILTIDLGTTKICAAAVDAETLKPLAVVSCANDADVAGLETDMHEQCPRKIWGSVSGLIRQIINTYPEAKDVVAISISGQMHGVMLVDANLEPCGNFITWRDSRGRSDEYDDAIRQRVGCQLHAGYGGATLSWLAGKGLIEAGMKALSLADYIAAKFSSVMANETTHAASWGILDMHKNRWDGAVISRLGISEKVLCEVKSSGSPLAKIDKQVAEDLGLPKSAIVCSPVGDNQASVIGAVGFDLAALVVNLGTGGQVSIPDSAGKFVAGFETRPMPGGGFIQVGASLCGGWSYAYLKNFCKDLIMQLAEVDLPDEVLYSKLNELAAKAALSESGLVVDTRFAGVRGDAGIRGDIHHINITNFNIGELAYAFLEGMTVELYRMAKPMLGGIKRVVASGNAVRKNPLMPAVIAKTFGMECRVSVSQEEAAIGAAAVAAMMLGLLSPETISRCLRNE